MVSMVIIVVTMVTMVTMVIVHLHPVTIVIHSSSFYPLLWNCTRMADHAGIILVGNPGS